MTRTLVLLVASWLLALCGCTQGSGNPKTNFGTEARSNPPAASPAAAPDRGGTAPKIDGDRAMKYVREVVALGPRPVGSPAHKKL